MISQVVWAFYTEQNLTAECLSVNQRSRLTRFLQMVVAWDASIITHSHLALMLAKILLKISEKNFVQHAENLKSDLYNVVLLVCNIGKMTFSNIFNEVLSRLPKAESSTLKPSLPSSSQVKEETPDQQAKNTTVVLSASSPITQSERDNVDEIMAEFNPIIKEDTKAFINFIRAIRARNFAKALRNACASDDPRCYEIIVKLFNHPKLAFTSQQLQIMINEQAGEGENKRAAMHHAARYHHQAVYEFLVKHGGDVSVKDGAGITPKEYLEREKSVLKPLATRKSSK